MPRTTSATASIAWNGRKGDEDSLVEKY